ncbi:MAG: hypothetical protein V4540_18870 [Pseudomonadota bacterium]
MIAGTVPIKTPQGQAELTGRQRRVGQRHRTVLFLVDGKRSAAEVRGMALQAGVPEACFDELLALGLIMLIEPPRAPVDAPPQWPDAPHIDLPLPVPGPAGALPDSLLPPSRTLSPSISTESMLGDSRGPESWLPSGPAASDAVDPVVAEARQILLRAVKAEAPLAGSLTLLRLRRARTRADLARLLDEVEARITKPHRSLAAGQTMRRVRQLLGSRADSALLPA